MQTINVFLDLTKIRITSMVMITTAFGYLFASGNVTYELFVVSFGVWLLASGSAVLNHIQEWQSDALMERTMFRPLPTGVVTPITATILTMFLILFGSAVLYHSSGWLAFGLGMLALVWYNGVYTPLKKHTPFAVVPGSLIGAIPPVIGWVAAGGSIFEPRIALIAMFFFIWQIPHFWILLLIHKEDYEKTKYPVLTSIFSVEQIGRISFVWILATISAVLFFPVIGVVSNSITIVAICIASGWLLYKSFGLVKADFSTGTLKEVFTGINIFVLFVIAVLSIDRLTNII